MIDGKVRIVALGMKPVAKGSHSAFMPPGASRPVVVDNKAGKLKKWTRLIADAVFAELPALAGRAAAATAAAKGRAHEPKVKGAARKRPWVAEIVVSCTVHAVFFVPRPGGHFRKSGELKPSAVGLEPKGTSDDLDKQLRGVLDVLTSTGVIHDDGLVCRIVAEKRYSATKGEQHCGVAIDVMVGA